MNPQNNQQAPQPSAPENTPEPVAYDASGRPLYHHPPVQQASQPAVPQQPAQPHPQPQTQQPTQQPQPDQATHPYSPSSHVTNAQQRYEGHNFDPQLRAQYGNEPHVVHATRAVEPQVPDISPELRQKHEESKKQYPFLNLSEGEFVLMSIRRHPIGMVIPVLFTAIPIVLLGSVAMLYPDIYNESNGANLPGVGIMVFVLLMAMLLVGLGGFIAVWVYLQNRFYLTNESIIQEIQHNLFSRHEQTVSLGSIEDASFKKYGVLQLMFDYGTIRLSTEGEETTYRFQYVAEPKKQVAIVNNAVEAFKNGRPVGVNFYQEDQN